MIQIFLDTANIDEIKEILDWGVISGITTNQKIFSNEKGINFETRSKEILDVAYPYPVSLEGPNDYDGIIKFAKEVKEWGKNVVIKVPMLGNGDGLRAIRYLENEGIKTNATACMTLGQTILASCAGATYVSLFYRRMADMVSTRYALDTIRETMKSIDSKLIVGSIRKLEDVRDITLVSPDIITIPYKILKQMPYCEETEYTLKEFEKAWEDFNKA